MQSRRELIKSSIYNLWIFTKKISSCQNNPEKSYAEKKTEHKPSGYSWSLICSFDPRENTHNFYREKDCIEKFCEDLKVLAITKINYEEKQMIPLKKISLMKSK